LDVGGTTVKAMLVDQAGDQVGELVEVRSNANQGYRKTFVQLEKALSALAESSGVAEDAIAAVGLDVPVPCSDGVVWAKSNLSADWVGVNIQEELATHLGRPVTMTNDCNAAAYGEYLYRKEHRNLGLLFVAPGTGLGGGLVLPGGALYEGAHGLALEVGDLTVSFREKGRLPIDGRGREGCLEGWVSLVALRRQLQAKLATRRYADHPMNHLDAPIEEKAFHLRDYAERGDALALEIFHKQAFILGFALGDLASILDPGLIVIGGGLAETRFRDWFLKEVYKGFQHRAAKPFQQSPIPPHPQTTFIEWAVGGDASAAFGAAHMARTRYA
jgi:glucokinase